MTRGGARRPAIFLRASRFSRLVRFSSRSQCRHPMSSARASPPPRSLSLVRFNATVDNSPRHAIRSRRRVATGSGSFGDDSGHGLVHVAIRR